MPPPVGESVTPWSRVPSILVWDGDSQLEPPLAHGRASEADAFGGKHVLTCNDDSAPATQFFSESLCWGEGHVGAPAPAAPPSPGATPEVEAPHAVQSTMGIGPAGQWLSKLLQDGAKESDLVPATQPYAEFFPYEPCTETQGYEPKHTLVFDTMPHEPCDETQVAKPMSVEAVQFTQAYPTKSLFCGRPVFCVPDESEIEQEQVQPPPATRSAAGGRIAAGRGMEARGAAATTRRSSTRRLGAAPKWQARPPPPPPASVRRTRLRTKTRAPHYPSKLAPARRRGRQPAARPAPRRGKR